jgi:choline dehydrogenase-like flavoprotein
LETDNYELRTEAHVLKIEHDDTGKVTGVLYADKDGNQQLQKARVVAVAGNSIESPRLLLNSASNMFPDGLANSSGQVGRNYMRHMTASVYAVFDKPVRMWRGTTMAGIITDESKHDPSRGFVGGYEMETLSLGSAVHGGVPRSRCLGPRLHRRAGRLREHGRHVAGGRGHAPGDQPRPSTHDVKDQYGLPCPTCISMITPTTSPCAIMPGQAGPGGL